MIKTEESAFLFYESFVDSIEQAKKYGKGLEMFQAIMDYGLYHKEDPLMDPMVAMAMPQIKVAIDHAQLRREEQQENGAKGGKAKRAKIDDDELRNFISQGGS